MSIIIAMCVLLGVIGLWMMSKRAQQYAQQHINHLGTKNAHLEQHLSQTLALIQELTEQMQQQQSNLNQQRQRLQQLEQQHAQVVEIMTQLAKVQQRSS